MYLRIFTRLRAYRTNVVWHPSWSSYERKPTSGVVEICFDAKEEASSSFGSDIVQDEVSGEAPRGRKQRPVYCPHIGHNTDMRLLKQTNDVLRRLTYCWNAPCMGYSGTLGEWPRQQWPRSSPRPTPCSPSSGSITIARSIQWQRI